MQPTCPCDDCKKLGTECCHILECEYYKTYKAQMYIWRELTKEFHHRVMYRETTE